MQEIPKSYGVITISTTISRPLWEKAQKYGIGWSEALRVGLTFLLSNRGDDEYLNPLQQQKKIEQLAGKISEIAQEKDKLEQELNALRWQK